MNNKTLAKTLELQARIIAIQIEVEGMKALNIERESHGHTVGYSEESFMELRKEVLGYADVLRGISEG